MIIELKSFKSQIGFIWPSLLRLGDVDEWFTHKTHRATYTLNTLMQICPGPYMDTLIYTQIYIHDYGQLATIHTYTYIHEWFTSKTYMATYTLNTLMQICSDPYMDTLIYTHIYTYIYTWLWLTCNHTYMYIHTYVYPHLLICQL